MTNQTTDPGGYRRLYDKLTEIQAELLAVGFDAAAKQVRLARGYYGGMPTEFLGETRIILRALLADELAIPQPVRSRIVWIVDQITEGFGRVGGN